MRITDKAVWDKGVANNQDGYGKAIYLYAERWADLMEAKIDAGEKLADIAKQASHDADVDGITGFMYGVAVSVLSSVWQHGKELREWHNLDCQIGNEGERANKEGKILNPALLSITEK